MLKAITAAELMKADIPPIEWLIEKLLPVGLGMIGAPSKYYKSYMALGMCNCICLGREFLKHGCVKYECLYLDLESTKRRPKTRLKQILQGENPPEGLHILTSEDGVKRIGEGFEEQMVDQLKQHPAIKLIVVDVFQMIRQPGKSGQSGYDRDYEDFKALKKLSDANNIAILLIHHTRKMKDPTDVFNELSGSVGVMGALDVAWVISKEDRYSEEGTLYITGRDMESIKLKIRFNKKTFQWEYVGTEEEVNDQRLLQEYEESPVVHTIKKLLEQNGGQWEGSASDIVSASKYMGNPIYDDVRKVGSLINKYEHLLFFDGIDYQYDTKTRGKRKYIFNVANATNVENVANATNVES